MHAIRSLRDVALELQRTPRTGWVDHQIPFPETIWQHSLSMRNVSRVLAKRYLGAHKSAHCGVMGGIHDVTESIVFDITPSMGISAEQKRGLELMAIHHIGSFSSHGAKIRDLWLEFEEGSTTEARFVKKVDKLHVTYLALHYEQKNACRYSLQPFWDYARNSIAETPLIEEWERLNALRPKNANDKPVLVRQPKPSQTYEIIKTQVMAKMGLA